MRVLQVCVLAFYFGVLAWPAQAADNNVALVDRFHNALIETMKQGKALGIEGRYRKLEPEIASAFDIDAMTRFTVGPKWPMMNDGEHKALVAAFRRMTVASYARNFDVFKDQQFVTDPVVEVRGLDRLVKSQIIPKGQKAVNLVYRMRETGGSVRIIDVIYEYVSQLATKRADFASTVNSGGAAALVKKLDEISDRLMKGN